MASFSFPSFLKTAVPKFLQTVGLRFYQPEARANVAKRNQIIRSVVHVRRTAKVTKGGKVVSLSALVVVGNGKGGAGFAFGKALKLGDAVKKASLKAIKNMTFIPRYMNSTIYHPITYRFHKSTVALRPSPLEDALRVNHAIDAICRCAGIQSLSGKVHGSRNIVNVVQATFKALQSQETHLERARRLGVKAIDVHETRFDQQMEINEKYNQLQLQLLQAKLAQNKNFQFNDEEEGDEKSPKKLQ